MKLVPVDAKTISKGYKHCGNQAILEEFDASGLDFVEVIDWPHKSSNICAAALRKSAERFRMNNIRIVNSGGHVYLVREK